MSASSSGSGLGSGKLLSASPSLGNFPINNGPGLGLGIPASPRVSSAGAGSVGTSGDVEEEIDPDVPLPTFEVQPAMLAVDLSLMPGESRSCGFFLVSATSTHR
jgi:hypothetical protein